MPPSVHLSIDEIIDSWPEKARSSARTVVEHYGPPHEATPRMLAWHGDGP